MITWIKIVLALLQLINSIVKRVSQAQWEASGYKKAMQDELLAISASVGIAKESFEEAAKATSEERRRSLKDPI